MAKGKDFLNLFAYTGSATVHAALGGAKSTHWAKTWLLHEDAPKVEKPAVIANLHDKIREKMGFAHLAD